MHQTERLLKLLSEEGPRLHRLLYRLTLRADVAEDLFQELFLRLLAALATAYWLFAPTWRGELAFAGVQDKVNQTKSVSMTLTSQEGDRGTPAGKGYALADGRVRMEQPDGHYSVIDPKAEISLAVDPKTKTALLIRGYHNRLPVDVYQTFRDIQKDEVRKLPGEKVDGRDVEVFVARLKLEGNLEAKVWVDPKTQLPFRLVMGDPSAKAGAMRIDLEFDKPLDTAMFSITPPEGYTVRTEGTGNPLQPVKDKDLQAPTVTAGEGIGPVKFGMSKKEVIDKLGEPDKIDQRGTALDYLSRGYSIVVGPQRGVQMIHCYTQATFIVKVKDFAGKTKEGIGMGATSADIIKAYGPPDEKESEEETLRLKYRKQLGMEFTLFADKLVSYSLYRVMKK